MKKSPVPHDQFFKAAFSEKEIAIIYFRKFLPKEIVKRLDLDQLALTSESFVTGNLKDFYADLVYSCPYGQKDQILLTLLFEHKSKKPPYPHVQLLRYILEYWERQIKEKKPLNVVLPIIVYHGKAGWKQKRFAQYFKGIDKHLEPFIPEFNFLLTDLSSFSDEILKQMQLGVLFNVFLAMKHTGETEYIRNNFQELFNFLDEYMVNERGRNLAQALFVYLSISSELKQEDIPALVETLPEQFKTDIMSTYDQIVLKGDKKRALTGIKNMLREGFRIEDIMRILEVPREWVEEVQAQLKKKE